MEVVLIAAVTLDGYIAHASQESSLNWTSKEDTRWFAQKTKEIGYCVMGSTTFATINKPLPGRQIFVLSSKGEKLNPTTIGEKGTVVTTSVSPQELVQALQERGVESLAVCGGSSIYTQFLRGGLITRLFLTVEPVLFGQGVPLLSEPTNIRLQQQSEFALSATAFVREYTVVSLQ